MVKLSLQCQICGREEEVRGLWFRDIDRKALALGWDARKDGTEICGRCRKSPDTNQKKLKNS